MALHGVFLSVQVYALGHETAHGTAFRTRWPNEAVLWVTSLLYFEEPLHRRYTHANHHTYTWHVGKDSQMPFDTPMDFRGWLAGGHWSWPRTLSRGQPVRTGIQSTIGDGSIRSIRQARIWSMPALSVSLPEPCDFLSYRRVR